MNNPIESKPIFAVGEIAVLQSKSCLELNGEYPILDFVRPGEDVIIDGEMYINDSTQCAYKISAISPKGHCWWAERMLRKRHHPGEYSFEDLKTILYLPQSRDEIARLERGMQA